MFIKTLFNLSSPNRNTKPLSFADCIGDELPVGWEEAYDPQVGSYYVDHNTRECCHAAIERVCIADSLQTGGGLRYDFSVSAVAPRWWRVERLCVLGCDEGYCWSSERTQIEDPRVQWQREQESMLKDYLGVAQDSLVAQKQICQVKEQRLQLAQQEYRQLSEAWRDKSASRTSCKYREN